MNKESKIRAAALLFITTTLAACNLWPQNESTESPETPTSTPTLSPYSPEEVIVKGLIENSPPKSDYPALLNVLGIENDGITSKTTTERFVDYFSRRILAIEAHGNDIQRLDRMFGQLSLPVKDLADRTLNFDWKNGGQGLGFDLKDLSTLNYLNAQKMIQDPNNDGIFSPISRLGEDGRNRSMILTTARDFEKAVLVFVDEYLRLNGIPNPGTDPSVQGERQALFEKIIYGDYGVDEIGQGDLLWQTVNDNFEVCETFTADADTRINQPEATRHVEFDPDLEAGGLTEEDIPSMHDSDNPVLVVMVAGATGELRVETYDLSDPTDPLNPSLDGADIGEVRGYGGRWLPCGVNISPSATPNVPNVPNTPNVEITPTPKRPTPTPEWPTPVPTNEHRDEPNPELTDTPDRISPTPIP